MSDADGRGRTRGRAAATAEITENDPKQSETMQNKAEQETPVIQGGEHGPEGATSRCPPAPAGPPAAPLRRICVTCDEVFCEACAARLHRSGNSAGHLRVPIQKCDECQFQVSSRQRLSGSGIV